MRNSLLYCNLIRRKENIVNVKIENQLSKKKQQQENKEFEEMHGINASYLFI